MNRYGAMGLAIRVIELAFEDLGKNNTSAALFFESPFYLALFCGLADVEPIAVYNMYRSIKGKPPITEQSQAWLEKGKTGIYKDGRLVAVATTVSMACDICGISTPTLYKYARTGEVTDDGYQIRKRISRRTHTGKRPHIKIEITMKDGTVQHAIGYKEAASIIGANQKRMQHILDAGQYKGFRLRRVRGYRRGFEK